MGKTKQKPVEEVRIGTIKAAIWRNEADDGTPFYGVTFTRLYKRGGDWAYSDSFGRDDLLLLQKVADEAFDSVRELEQRDREE